jgi:hypothetical protein
MKVTTMTDRVMRMILLAICATLNFATPSTGLASIFTK